MPWKIDPLDDRNSHAPLPAETFSDMEGRESKDVQLAVIFGENMIRPLFIIVETWDHKKCGRGKRQYLREFSEQERRTLGKWHTSLYDWYMRRGIPHKGVRMSLKTYELLCRAANFFATI